VLPHSLTAIYARARTSQAREVAIKGFSKDMLLVADTVDLAIKYAPMDEVNKVAKSGGPPNPTKVRLIN
jgi:hypothetical protein